MAAENSGLPQIATYSAYNTNTQQFVSGDQVNHTIELILDGVSLGAPTNAINSLGDGVYSIALTPAERAGVDLILKGSSSTADIIIVPMQFSSDVRWLELLEDDGGDQLRGTAKFFEESPVADVSGLALESSVQTIITTGGAGPWTTGSGGGGEKDWTDTERNQIRKRLGVDGVTAVSATAPDLALEASLQSVKTVTDKFTFNADDVVIADTQYWQGQEISGVQMIEDLTGQPRWTIRALSNAPQGGAGGSVTYVSKNMENKCGFYEILRGDTFRLPVLLDMALASAIDIVFSIKRDSSDADEDSLLYISVASGLQYVNGEIADTPVNGSVLIDSSAVGVVLITCTAEEMAKLPEIQRSAVMELQVETASSIMTPWRRTVSIVGDIVRAT